MYVSTVLFSAGLAAAAALPRQAEGTCTNPPKRVEWRTLDREAQQHYVDSVKCMTEKPSEMGLANTTRYDDFAYVHTKLDHQIHSVAQFLPWHRLFVQAYENALHDCGFQGVMPYWEWSLDTADVTNSPIWDANKGFGGNGDPAIDPLVGSAKKCLVDGPFAGLQVAWTMQGHNPHCLARNFNNGTSYPGNMFSNYYDNKTIVEIATLDNYPDFRYRLEGVPHGAIHSAVGGDMSPATSPNDPIFFLHHTQVDRLWSMWQQAKPEERTTAFGGPKTQAGETPEATIEDTMSFLGLIPDVKIKEVMSTQTALLCYTY
ncbi:Di-copper centre-containing protein [Colletotrichum zoysiae]|uniref:Di-copper centre-containing protein n=1 Tax=Colletotrichum zoysiae TaxID=1216348 RepID=A0AAD9M5H0_9PEZI|nr:Di-copper centre-containing protein [Colletotrichum zoysiae]